MLQHFNKFFILVPLIDLLFFSYCIVAQPKIINGVSVPSDFPELHITTNLNPAPGKIFITNSNGNNFYLMIFKNDGTPYFYRRINLYSFDYKVQRGNLISFHSFDELGFILLNSNYERINLIKAQNGYNTDMHDFFITEEQTALLIATEYKIVDMSQLVAGGTPNATVLGNVIQELDFDNNVIFEWNTFEHFNILDAVNEDLTGSSIDFTHINSVSVDYDGHILISSRHLSECTKINRNTGEIIWRLGGVNNQFRLIDESYSISYQHSFYPVDGEPNHYIIYDNGNFRDNFTRVVEYVIDQENMTATKVWEYRSDPDFYTEKAGNAQRLTNGNTLINMVVPEYPKVIELTPDNEIVYQANFSPEKEAYKAFKFEWEAIASAPYLITEPLSGGVRLIFNKFGDNDVQLYNIYGGEFDQPTSIIKSTTLPYCDIDLRQYSSFTEYYFRITSIDKSGIESEYSNSEKVILSSIYAGNSSGVLGSTNLSDESDPVREKIYDEFNGQLRFDGINDYANCGNDVSLQIAGKNITIEALINVLSFPPEPYEAVIICKDMRKEENNAGYRVGIKSEGAINFTFGNNSFYELSTPANVIRLNTWHHVAATYDGINSKIYIDGELTAESGPLNIDIKSAANKNLLFGSSSFDEDKFYAGFLDEVRIWNITRTQDDIIASLNKELEENYYTNPESGLVGYWPFNEENGQIIEDLAKDDNKILNGYFSLGSSFWDLITSETLNAEYFIENNQCIIRIENGGSFPSDIEFKQGNIILLSNESYRLEFDAWVTEPKIATVRVRKAVLPMTDYSRIGSIYITESPKHFEYNFTMDQYADDNAELVFQLGGSATTLYLDNVKLLLDGTSNTFIHQDNVSKDYDLIGNFPNPFNPETTIQYTIPETCEVKISIYNLLGQLIKTLFNGIQNKGKYNIVFSGINLSSGIYFYNIETRSKYSDTSFSKTKKMILLK